MPDAGPAAAPSLWRDRRFPVMLLLGFAAGVPLPLVAGQVLRRAGAEGEIPPAAGSGEEGGSRPLKRGKLTLDPARHDCLWDGKPVKLTVTEFLLLQSLAQRPGFVKSRDNLMDAAYDDQVYVDDRTIDSHIKRMRKKFREVDPEFDAIETLYGVGYRYREA